LSTHSGWDVQSAGDADPARLVDSLIARESIVEEALMELHLARMSIRRVDYNNN
jgi:hypothetical protein